MSQMLITRYIEMVKKLLLTLKIDSDPKLGLLKYLSYAQMPADTQVLQAFRTIYRQCKSLALTKNVLKEEN
jgi:hypothetical protein